jgi:hypothetical protein
MAENFPASANRNGHPPLTSEFLHTAAQVSLPRVVALHLLKKQLHKLQYTHPTVLPSRIELNWSLFQKKKKARKR